MAERDFFMRCYLVEEKSFYKIKNLSNRAQVCCQCVILNFLQLSQSKLVLRQEIKKPDATQLRLYSIPSPPSPG